MKSLAWTHLARDDLAAIDAYWFAINAVQADVLLDRIEAAACFLRGTPLAGSALEGGKTRKWAVRKTRHLLIYRLRLDQVEILRVRHASEDWDGS